LGQRLKIFSIFYIDWHVNNLRNFFDPSAPPFPAAAQGEIPPPPPARAEFQHPP
jgi:hypothetical protein